MISTLLVDKYNIDAYYVELERMDKELDDSMEYFIPYKLLDYTFTFSEDTPFRDLITKDENNQWYIIKNEKDIVIGYMFIRRIPENNITNLCSLYIKPEHRRKGYAKEAISMLPKGTTVTVNVYTNNEPAKILYEKLGFKPWTQNMYKEL